KNWGLRKLGDICEKVEKVKRKDKENEEEFLYLDISGINNITNKIVEHKVYQWGNAPSRAQQVINTGDVLFLTVRTYLKNIAIVERAIYNDQIASSGFCVIRAKKDLVDPRFLFYF